MNNVTPISPQSRIMKDKRASDRIVANDDWAWELRQRLQRERVDRIIEDIENRRSTCISVTVGALAAGAWGVSLATAAVLYFVAELVLR